ncbi:hypothetical protein PEP31012_00879 [Pandoraea eparura]|uniref:Uncharacterized protein n=1 Tax=Pandoraea eparura TaxID=2508291 RepID=A0A5E4SS69_9BURK|nr:beta-hexosaminidase [Pandoraea eparura]VVD76679.1 hypothetical protein PEP31012_00879 [Pandoraea eparura]
MTKPYILSGPDRDHRAGTISLMSTISYDPMAPRPTSPLLIGKYVVHRKPLARTPMMVYMIMLGNVVVGTQISIPSIADCDAASKRERARLAAVAEAQTARDAKVAACDMKSRATRSKHKAANAARAKEAA